MYVGKPAHLLSPLIGMECMQRATDLPLCPCHYHSDTTDSGGLCDASFFPVYVFDIY